MLIPMRIILMPPWFTQKELEIMDSLTADNEAVVASLGGMPQLPGGTRSKDYGLEQRKSEDGVRRQRVGSIHH
jgi:hypothetical protein